MRATSIFTMEWWSTASRSAAKDGRLCNLQESSLQNHRSPELLAAHIPPGNSDVKKKHVVNVIRANPNSCMSHQVPHTLCRLGSQNSRVPNGPQNPSCSPGVEGPWWRIQASLPKAEPAGAKPFPGRPPPEKLSSRKHFSSHPQLCSVLTGNEEPLRTSR